MPVANEEFDDRTMQTTDARHVVEVRTLRHERVAQTWSELGARHRDD
jgi:hypothetical protein